MFILNDTHLISVSYFFFFCNITHTCELFYITAGQGHIYLVWKALKYVKISKNKSFLGLNMFRKNIVFLLNFL